MKFEEKLYQLRKEANLSQEQLADMLHVSRQAVGKWESGSALPDINNMIELSKIFHVSLNELLQVEQERESCDETNWEYLKEWQAQQNKKTNKETKTMKTGLIVLGVVSLVLATLLFVQGRSIRDLRSEMNSQYSSLLASINNSNHYYPVSNDSISLFEQIDWDFTEMNEAERKVQITGRLALKEFSDTTTIQLRFIEDGEEYIVDTLTESAGIYTFDEWLKKDSEHVSIYAIVSNEGKSQTELILDLTDFKKYINYTVMAYDKLTFEFDKADKEMKLWGSVEVDIEFPYRPVEYYIESMEMEIHQGSELLQSVKATQEQLEPRSQKFENALEILQAFGFPLEIENMKVKFDKPVTVKLKYTTSNGVEYEQEVTTIQINNDGEPHFTYPTDTVAIVNEY